MTYSFPSSLPQKVLPQSLATVFLLYCRILYLVIVKLYIYISYLPMSWAKSGYRSSRRDLAPLRMYELPLPYSLFLFGYPRGKDRCDADVDAVLLAFMFSDGLLDKVGEDVRDRKAY